RRSGGVSSWLADVRIVTPCPRGGRGPVTRVVLGVGPVLVSTVVPFWVDIHRTEFLSGKIEHHFGALREELMRDRTRFDEERYIRRFREQEIVARLDAVEVRVARLEAQSSPSS